VLYVEYVDRLASVEVIATKSFGVIVAETHSDFLLFAWVARKS
jgi:hypothetical protein